jgi:hypothetical protein
MLHRVALVRTDVSEELSASSNRVKGIGETSVLTRVSRRPIQEDGILYSHCRGNLNSYTGYNILLPQNLQFNIHYFLLLNHIFRITEAVYFELLTLYNLNY